MNRMRIVCLCGLGLMVCVAMRVLAADAPPQGFEAVFNGKDLSGFKPHDKQKMEELQQHWTFKDDGVVEYNPTGKKGEMTLWTAKEYGDLVLMLDWRWVGPANKMQRPYLDPARCYTRLRNRCFARREREAPLRIFDTHPAVNDANLGDLARWIDQDEEFRSFDTGGHVRSLNVEGSVTRAEQVDDPAGQVEQRPTRLARRKNPQCGALIEAYHLSGFFEANGRSAARTHQDSLPRAQARLGPGRHGLNRTARRTND